MTKNQMSQAAALVSLAQSAKQMAEHLKVLADNSGKTVRALEEIDKTLVTIMNEGVGR